MGVGSEQIVQDQTVIFAIYAVAARDAVSESGIGGEVFQAGIVKLVGEN